MKHRGKAGKRAGPVGYRTPSTFRQRKVQVTADLKAKRQRGCAAKRDGQLG